MNLFGRVIMAFMPITPKAFIRFISRRYVAGPELDDALRVMREMSSENTSFTVDVLGEDISTLEGTQPFIEEYNRLIEAISQSDLNAHVSLKPTAFGLDIDYGYALKALSDIVRKANESQIYVRLDMEDSTHTESTLKIMEDLYSAGHLNVGVVLQGRLLRTNDDLLRIAETMGKHADVRICKGIYLEPSEIAHTSYSDIVNATSDAVETALDLGMYVGIASHDHPVINAALQNLQSRGIMPEKPDPRNPAPEVKPGKGGGYEFQFLLGVRGDVRRRLASNGHLTRVYLPYGKQWYEYSMRRLRENPGIAWHVAKSIIMPWTNRR